MAERGGGSRRAVFSGVFALIYVRRSRSPFQSLLTGRRTLASGDWSSPRRGRKRNSRNSDRLASAFDGMAAEVSSRELKIHGLAR